MLENWVGLCGGVAQLGEHLLCKQRVVGSSPSTSILLIFPGYFAVIKKLLQNGEMGLAVWGKISMILSLASATCYGQLQKTNRKRIGNCG